MASDIVTLVDDSANTGDKVDVFTVTVGANTVIRQVVCLGDPSTGTSANAINAADAALSETAVVNLRTVAAMFALDGAASAGSQNVPLKVESTAQPNLRVSHYNGANAMPAGDAVARRIYIQHTDGTNSTPAMDSNARPAYVTHAGSTANGMSKGKFRDQKDTATVIKGSAGTLYDLEIENDQAAIAYIQIFDAASGGAVTLGTTEPDWEVKIPASVRGTVSFPNGLSFSSGIVIYSTTASKGNTGSASGVHVHYQYK